MQAYANMYSLQKKPRTGWETPEWGPNFTSDAVSLRHVMRSAA